MHQLSDRRWRVHQISSRHDAGLHGTGASARGVPIVPGSPGRVVGLHRHEPHSRQQVLDSYDCRSRGVIFDFLRSATSRIPLLDRGARVSGQSFGDSREEPFVPRRGAAPAPRLSPRRQDHRLLRSHRSIAECHPTPPDELFLHLRPWWLRTRIWSDRRPSAHSNA